MFTKLDSKDIKLLESSVKSEASRIALQEYLSAHDKAEVAWKVLRDSLLLSEDDISKVGVKKERKFKAGDKVRVTSVASDVATTWLSVGDVAEVITYKNDLPESCPFIGRRPVIVTGGRSRRAYFEESALELVVEEQGKSPNELRAEVIQRAKEVLELWKRNSFVGLEDYQNSELPFPCNHWSMVAEFVINPEKRTVVALLKGHETLRLATKGIAKCAHDDVFNEHIGKAIALGRALGKDVSEFENAIQPTEPVIGHVVEGIESVGFYRRDRKFTLTSKQGDSFYYAEAKEYEPNEPDDFIFNDQIGKIVDDTNAQYSSSTDQGH